MKGLKLELYWTGKLVIFNEKCVMYEETLTSVQWAQEEKSLFTYLVLNTLQKIIFCDLKYKCKISGQGKALAKYETF